MTILVQANENAGHALANWGLGVHFQQLFLAWRNDHPEVQGVIGRVVAWEHGCAEVIIATSDVGNGELHVSEPNSDGAILRWFCEPTGTLRRQFDSSSREAGLVAGDWVVVEGTIETATGRIVEVLPRRSHLRRRMAGTSSKVQTIAVNVDKVLVVTSANNDFNLRRLERYLVAVWDSGATPIVVLNKIDLVDDVDAFLRDVGSVAAGAEVVAVSAQSCEGLGQLGAKLRAGETIALVGSSGVGKSSLINRLIGRDVAVTGGLDSQDKGRHTTTRRSLVALPHGGVLIDNPGMREFGLVDSEGGLQATFGDIADLALSCRFHDCAHRAEPGCAVLGAIERGNLDAERLRSFHKLEREMAASRARTDLRLQASIKQRYKAIAKAHRALEKAPTKR